MTKAQYIESMKAELAELNERIANYDMSHDGINEFISKDVKLRKMKQRRQGIMNAIASLA